MEVRRALKDPLHTAAELGIPGDITNYWKRMISAERARAIERHNRWRR